MSEPDPFDGAREALAGVRSVLIEHAVRTGFADLLPDEMEAPALWYLEQVTTVAIPYINRAIIMATKAGMPDDVLQARVQDTMEFLSAMVQDALRECGMDIQIVAFPVSEAQ